MIDSDTRHDHSVPKTGNSLGDPPASPPAHPRLVVVLSRDLFFGMRIRTSLRQLGFVVSIAQDASAFAAQLGADDQWAVLGLIDFNLPVDWPALAHVMEMGIPMVAFGPHKDVDGFRAAKQAGVTRVIANGEFSRTLPELAERYATPVKRAL